MPTDDEILAYLDEMLPSKRAAEIEQLLRERTDLRHRAALIARRRDQGGHTVGEIWRRRQLSCLSREDLGTFILGAADPDLEDYIIFHTETVGCRICSANLADLKTLHADANQQQDRRKRYFETSAGLFRSQHGEQSGPSDPS